MGGKKVRVRIPSYTVEVDVETWASQYGVEPDMVPADVLRYFVHQRQGARPVEEGFARIVEGKQ